MTEVRPVRPVRGLAAQRLAKVADVPVRVVENRTGAESARNGQAFLRDLRHEVRPFEWSMFEFSRQPAPEASIDSELVASRVVPKRRVTSTPVGDERGRLVHAKPGMPDKTVWRDGWPEQFHRRRQRSQAVEEGPRVMAHAAPARRH